MNGRLQCEQERNARRIVVLMYHRIGEAASRDEAKYCVSPQRFAAHLAALRQRGLSPCTLSDFLAWTFGRSELPDGSLLLTFDDGYGGVYEHAFPLLSSLCWPATVFLVSGLIGGRDRWIARSSPGARQFPLLTRSQIEEMAHAGFSFESHSRNHRDLTSLSPQALLEELAGARDDLEGLLGRAVRCLAYPYGAYNQRVLQAARASGYCAGFSVQPGFNRRGIDPYRLRRLDVHGSDTPGALLRKIALGTNDGSYWNVVKYYGGRLGGRVMGDLAAHRRAQES